MVILTNLMNLYIHIYIFCLLIKPLNVQKVDFYCYYYTQHKLLSSQLFYCVIKELTTCFTFKFV